MTFLTMVAFPCHAFQRDGFHLKLGAGAGLGSWDISEGGLSESSGSASFATGFQIGLNASEQVAVYYVQRTAWFNSNVTILPGPFGGPLTPQEASRVLTQGTSGLGLTYFLRPQAPSFFLTAGIGLAWWSQVFEESTSCIKLPIAVPCSSVTGIGVTASGGYELTRLLSAEAFVMWGDPDKQTALFEVQSSSTVVGLLLGLTLF